MSLIIPDQRAQRLIGGLCSGDGRIVALFDADQRNPTNLVGYLRIRAIGRKTYSRTENAEATGRQNCGCYGCQ
jgi:hypothetical protein